MCVCITCFPGAWWHCCWPMCTNLNPHGRLIVAVFLSSLIIGCSDKQASCAKGNSSGRGGGMRKRWWPCLSCCWLCPAFSASVSLLWAIAWCVSARSEAGFSPEAFLGGPLSRFLRTEASFSTCTHPYILRFPRNKKRQERLYYFWVIFLSLLLVIFKRDIDIWKIEKNVKKVGAISWGFSLHLFGQLSLWWLFIIINMLFCVENGQNINSFIHEGYVSASKSFIGFGLVFCVCFLD